MRVSCHLSPLKISQWSVSSALTQQPAWGSGASGTRVMGSNHLTSTPCNCSLPSGTTSGVAENMLTSSPRPREEPAFHLSLRCCDRPLLLPGVEAHECLSMHTLCQGLSQSWLCKESGLKACDLQTGDSSPNPNAPCGTTVRPTSVDRSSSTCHGGSPSRGVCAWTGRRSATTLPQCRFLALHQNIGFNNRCLRILQS